MRSATRLSTTRSSGPRRRAATDPIAVFRRWFGRARRAGLALPESMAVATSDGRGRPSVRFMLLKEVDPRGFVFFTDARSRKGDDLRANPRAALAFHWEPLARQVRVEGRIEEVSPEEADAYWKTRPRESRLAALSSTQSAPLPRRAALLDRWRQFRRELASRDVSRPAYWKGFRLVPEAVELWTGRPHRLHERELFTRTARGWRRTLLQP